MEMPPNYVPLPSGICKGQNRASQTGRYIRSTSVGPDYSLRSGITPTGWWAKYLGKYCTWKPGQYLKNTETEYSYQGYWRIKFEIKFALNITPSATENISRKNK